MARRKNGETDEKKVPVITRTFIIGYKYHCIKTDGTEEEATYEKFLTAAQIVNERNEKGYRLMSFMGEVTEKREMDVDVFKANSRIVTD